MPEDKDLRIHEAEVVGGVIKHEGFKVLQREWEKIKAQALADLTNETLSDDTLKARQVIHNQITEWIDLPDMIIKRGDEAIEEDKEPKQKGSFLKKAVPFLGRRY